MIFMRYLSIILDLFHRLFFMKSQINDEFHENLQIFHGKSSDKIYQKTSFFHEKVSFFDV